MAWLDHIPLALLAPGSYPLAKDQYVRFDGSDLARMAGAFNKASPLRPAPIVFGHPENDSPSYGRIDYVTAADGELLGYAVDLTETFRHGMRDGNYPRYAAQFFAPENPKNPVPGAWFLKHVGFVGPVPPSVRGYLTTDAEFMESLSGPGRRIEPEMRFGGAGLVEFSQFAAVPTRAEDIAKRARALQAIAAVNGQVLSATEAVAASRSSLSKA